MFSASAVFYQITHEERLLKASFSTTSANFHTDCDIAIAMGSDIPSTRGLYASINSIIANYQGGDRKLCFYVFATKEDFPMREKGLDCVFGDGGLPANVEIIKKQINRDTWYPMIYSKDEEELADTRNKGSNAYMEYMYARYYLRPEDVDGMQRVIWIDSDSIVLGDVQELYDWDMHGNAVAAVNYWEPLKNYLCTNPRLDRIKMKTSGGRISPFAVNKHLSSGLLIIDLYQMQLQGILRKWHDLTRSHELDCLWTQSDKAFNLALNGQYEELPNVWNVGYLGTQDQLRHNDACQTANMLHWNGMGKPYNEGRGMSLCVDQFDLFDVVSLENKGKCLQRKFPFEN